VPGISPVLVVAVVLIAILTEMTGVVAVQVGASRRYDGPMGKSDRAFVFGLLALLLGSGFDLHFWADAALVVVAILSAMTVINRASKALVELDNRNESRLTNATRPGGELCEHPNQQ
jgi:CDP-diacylglycerol--glycerol-3-phosphate 3-phosphatidyltransferase